MYSRSVLFGGDEFTGTAALNTCREPRDRKVSENNANLN